MKNLILIFCLFSFTTKSQDDLKLFFPELDSELIGLWMQEDIQYKSDVTLERIIPLWEDIQPLLTKNLLPQSMSHICRIEELIIQMEVEADRNRYDLVKKRAWELLREFRLIRAEYTSYIYPLDYLLYTYESVAEIDYTVHDLMFGLRYWFEFRDLLNELDCYWNLYLIIPDEHLEFYNPYIELEKHRDLCLKFNDCKNAFLESLDSNYQTDYKVPISEMSDSLYELISVYSSKYASYENPATSKS